MRTVRECWPRALVLVLAWTLAHSANSTQFIYPEGGENWMAGKLGSGVPAHFNGNPVAHTIPRHAPKTGEGPQPAHADWMQGGRALILML